MKKISMAQVRKLVQDAVQAGKTMIDILGTALLIEHVAGTEYRATLPDGGEIVRVDRHNPDYWHVATA